MPASPLEEIHQKNRKHGENLDRAHPAAALDDLKGLIDPEDLVSCHESRQSEKVQQRTIARAKLHEEFEETDEQLEVFLRVTLYMH